MKISRLQLCALWLVCESNVYNWCNKPALMHIWTADKLLLATLCYWHMLQRWQTVLQTCRQWLKVVRTDLAVVRVWLVHMLRHTTGWPQYRPRHCHRRCLFDRDLQLISWAAVVLRLLQRLPAAAAAVATERPWLQCQEVVQSRLERKSRLEQFQLVGTSESSQLEVGRW